MADSNVRIRVHVLQGWVQVGVNGILVDPRYDTFYVSVPEKEAEEAAKNIARDGLWDENEGPTYKVRIPPSRVWSVVIEWPDGREG